jgi:hypothetical protein
MSIKNRSLFRSPQNPLDKATIVSIYPKAINQSFPTIQPGNFIIPAGKRQAPASLVIGSSSWWKELDVDQPFLEVPESAMIIAKAIITDYCNGLLEYSLNSGPGLFYLPGEVTPKNILLEIDLLNAAEVKQKNWFQSMVKTADTLWARTMGNPLAISDDMRLAAQELQLKDKAWMADFNTMELSNCPACGQLRNKLYPVCAHCNTVVDQKQYDDLKLKSA